MRSTGAAHVDNGASSSGKSTLAKALQRALEEPFLHVSSDQFVSAGMLPDRREDSGPFSWWNQMRPRFFAGFRRCLPALAESVLKDWRKRTAPHAMQPRPPAK
ncbi:chloramphenicol phosphotransferase CPT family protein [Planotetraspora sp. A-T 1434]|uniref:chloramphenicol phosphotransferase CPT family protein n=1 Tax=Planotetraspora sp. A-T 1434 TaxID=2979219 RepID=UPI0021C17745|nr:chloramphenicol phosphotransferase CPT family protein [Planotetraspora sp. A-T 1434]MCT9934911.1 chloramphenicol phosphotransferase CPT family protein [Planotetraspora sp. A-T 1434]